MVLPEVDRFYRQSCRVTGLGSLVVAVHKRRGRYRSSDSQIKLRGKNDLEREIAYLAAEVFTIDNPNSPIFDRELINVEFELLLFWGSE